MKNSKSEMEIQGSSPERARRAAAVALSIIAAAALVAVGAFAGRTLFAQVALKELQDSSAFAMAGNAAALQTKLQKFRLVPLALSTDPELKAALESPSEPLRESLNQRFEELAAASNAAAIYLVDRAGVTFAASNFRSPKSFIGQDYSFRSYFQKAIEHQEAEEFAIGTVSGEAGLYLSRSVVAEDGSSRGVIVVKLRFNDIEAAWRGQNRLIVAIDRDARIVVTPIEKLRFELLVDIDAGVMKTPLPIVADALGPAPALATVQPIDEAGWTALSFEPVSATLAAPRLLGALTGGSITALVLGAIALVLHRFERSARKVREVAAYRAHLERAVSDRTRELQESYARLTEETARRQSAQDLLRVTQEEIAQLNRLAILGQLSAKFAHEVNQPLAAMRNYIDISAKLLAAGDRGLVARNLETMSDLVMRVARITEELRSFSRKRQTIPADVRLGRIIEGALLIAGPAIEAASIVVERRGDADGVLVRVDQIRMEQVILNVIQNAIDALRDRPDPRIDIEAVLDGEAAMIRISDNGLGASDPEALFVPFRSDKEHGLGLGLSISREILAEFRGTIAYRPSSSGGASFEIRLPRSRA